tara:strand:- start:1719 stop:2069 length:351 start_codon:yes stop_codon:yes gene_type:complete
MGELVFEAQNYKPLYEYGKVLPRAWNSPMRGGWNVNYIKWEIGHLTSKNQLGKNNPENLSFQSARGNQLCQTSMNYSETTEYTYVKEVTNRIDNLFKLHKSSKWLKIKGQICILTQ